MKREQVHCHGAASRCCLSTPQASSFALPPSNASEGLGRTLYWLSHHVEQTRNEGYPSNQKNYQHHLHIRATLKYFFWSWRQFSHPLAASLFQKFGFFMDCKSITLYASIFPSWSGLIIDETGGRVAVSVHKRYPVTEEEKSVLSFEHEGCI